MLRKLSMKRASARWVVAILCLIGVYWLMVLRWDGVTTAVGSSTPTQKPKYDPKIVTEAMNNLDRLRNRQDYLDTVKKIFAKHDPKVGTLDDYPNGKATKKAFDDKLPYFTNEELAQFLQVPDDKLEKITKAHAAMVAELPDSFPEATFHGDGVVIASGGKYMPIAILTLRMLRRVSPTLPVEIFVADRLEYEKDLCTKVVPELGASCHILADVYGNDFMREWELETYQLKALALLASSFERVAFIDADSVPIRNVEAMFDEEPFKSTGYVIWPDYWFRTVSPHFYNVTGITLGERVRGDLSVQDPTKIPQADRDGAIPDKSNETGQILIDKRRHLRSLLLAVYYNLLGPKVYYPLLTQGGAGEGDKDTFYAAVHVLGLQDQVHRVTSGPIPMGMWFERPGGGKDFDGSGMAQVVPLDDYKQHVLHTMPEHEREARTQFLHINMYKMNPRLLFKGEHQDWFSDGHRMRIIGNPSENTKMFDWSDPELYLFTEMKWMICDVGRDRGILFKDWKVNSVNIDEMCDQVTAHLNWLQDTHLAGI